ncbi:MAG: asparaginase [Emcibacter sp.]|nr:asparaginase [Emcibacter sp.]
MALQRIKLLLLGGTITMDKSVSAGGGVVPTVEADALCRAVSGLDQVAQIDAQTECMVASGNLTYAHAISLAEKIHHAVQKDEADGFVIIQGTDTIEEMAFILDCLLDINKPVVVTGAMRSPAELSADGPANIMAAVISATTKSLGSAGVVVVMNDDIHRAALVRKCHTGSLAAFQSSNMGPIGRIVEGRARLFSVFPKGPRIKRSQNSIIPKIALIKVVYGDDGYLLKLLEKDQCDGLIIEGFGAGHVPETYLESLDKMVQKMPVILSSRTGSGHIYEKTYGFKGSEIDLLNRGLIPSGILDGLKARILLTLLLMSGANNSDIRTAFGQWSF